MVFRLKSILIGVGISFSAVVLNAQPIATKYNLAGVNEATVYTIKGYNAAALDAADNAPTRFRKIENTGRFLPAQLTTQNSGEWQTLRTGYLWRLKIKAIDAKGVSLFGKVKQLPKGATINIYNTNGTEWVNTYTAADFSTQNILSTETVSGEELIIEYFEPFTAKTSANIIIEGVGYMYRHHTKEDTPGLDDLGSSAGCQVNINCPEGSNWQHQKRAVVRIRTIRDFVIGNCTGALVRTVDKKYKPYLLSAMHCALTASEDTIINDTLFNYWTFSFNYESPNCANPLSDSTFNKQVIVGSKVLAHSNDVGGEYGSDFLLLELSKVVPSEFRSYYAGWDIDTVKQYDSGTTIHHPRFDIKKISTYKWPLSFEAPFSTSPDDTHWEVLWSSTGNGHGVTEPGSSGSPLFSSDGLIVGTLTGGSSSCSNTSSTDVFGRMDWHWTRNGADSTFQLKYWLDPDNTGITRLTGQYDELRSLIENKILPLQLYPNPTVNTLYFGSEYLVEGTKQIEIVDVLGKTHIEASLEGNTISTSNLATGVYFIKVKSKNNYFSGKFIKQ